MTHWLAGGLKNHSTVLYGFVRRDAGTKACPYKKEKNQKMCFAGGICICLLRDAENLLLSLFLEFYCHYEKDHQKKSLALLTFFATGGRAGRPRENLSVSSVVRRISRQCPVSAALQQHQWLREQLPFA